MKLIKLNALENFANNQKAEEVYINANVIVSVVQRNKYCEIEIVYPYGLRRLEVKETINDIQKQL